MKLQAWIHSYSVARVERPKSLYVASNYLFLCCITHGRALENSLKMKMPPAQWGRIPSECPHCKYLNARSECNDIVISVYSHYPLDPNAKSSDTKSNAFSMR